MPTHTIRCPLCYSRRRRSLLPRCHRARPQKPAALLCVVRGVAPASATMPGASTPRRPLLSCRASSADSQRQTLRPRLRSHSPRLVAATPLSDPVAPGPFCATAGCSHDIPGVPPHGRHVSLPLPEPLDPLLPALPRRLSPVAPFASPPQRGWSLTLAGAQATRWRPPRGPTRPAPEPLKDHGRGGHAARAVPWVCGARRNGDGADAPRVSAGGCGTPRACEAWLQRARGEARVRVRVRPGLRSGRGDGVRDGG